ncbi:MAG: S8 family serine peptidase [Rhodanobacteraceae bacterium]|nr:S8 family serine peptidase [Rhodanobacteraceae bacterium]
MKISLRQMIQLAVRYNPLALALFCGVVCAQPAEISAHERAAYAKRVGFSQSTRGEATDSFIVYYHGMEKRLPQNKRGKMARSEAESAKAMNLAAEDAVRASKRFGLSFNVVRELATGGILIRATPATGEPARALDVARVMMEIANNPDVSWVEPDSRVYAQFTPNDTFYHSQWNLFDKVGGINVEHAWEQTLWSNADPVVIAIVDSGITPHLDLAGQVVAGYDFISDAVTARDGNGRDADPNDEGDWQARNNCASSGPGSEPAPSSWHGTHVAGIAAARRNNALGIAGVAPGARILPLRVLGRCGGNMSDIADAIIWAAGGTVPSGAPAALNPTPARVINLSLGGLGPCTATYQSAIDTALLHEAVVVVAAGNDNVDVSGAVPANCAGVLAVAATTKAGNRAFNYSNFGSGIDVAAPGGIGASPSDDVADNPRTGDIPSTFQWGWKEQRRESYASIAGTSMAAPQVAGLAALLLARRPTLTASTIRNLIKQNTRPVPPDCNCGTGIIDAAKTLGAISSVMFPSVYFDVSTNGRTAKFVARTSPETVISRTWFFGDGSSSSAVNPTKTYKSNGTYRVALRILDSNRLIGYQERDVVITNASGVDNIPLQNGVAVSSADGQADSQRTFVMEIPQGATNLRFWTKGGTGTPDLYVRFGDPASQDNYDCVARYLGVGGNACIRTNPPAGTAYVILRGNGPFSGVSVVGEYTLPAVTSAP